MDSQRDLWKQSFEGIYRAAIGISILSGLAFLIGGLQNPLEFFRSYLLGFLFWLEVSLGCLAILMIYYLTGGYWGVAIRGLLQAGGSTLWLMALLFLPLPFGMKFLFKWALIKDDASDSLVVHPSGHLNSGFFVARAIVYFFIWIGFYFLLGRAAGNKHLLSRLSSVGLVMCFLSAVFASCDWFMSLQNEWYSIFLGMGFFVGCGLSAMAFIILVVAFLARFKTFTGVYPPQCISDLGNILLGVLSLWAFLSFSQGLLAWMSHQPEEIDWYLRRIHEDWQWCARGIAAFQFGVPFILLLFRQNKRRVTILASIAGLIFLVRWVEIYWSLFPSFHEHFVIHWMTVISPIALGSVWIAVFMHEILRRTLPQTELRTSAMSSLKKAFPEEV